MNKSTLFGSGRTGVRGGDAIELTKTSFLRAGTSAMALGALLVSTGVYAQDGASSESADNPEAEAPTDENVIVVTGIRAALESAQEIKRNADTVVDAITADDIGALADRSVTEALQRVPGVAINRFAGSNDPDHFSVEGSGVTIRGLTYVRSEFNGRTAFSAGVGGQALNFADVPPELLGSVVINKNSTAEMIEGGISGTVNLITRKPLDDDGFNVRFSAEANYGDLAEEWSPTVSGLISNTWDTELGTFGLLASATFSQIRNRADGLQVTNFQARDGSLVEAANSGGALTCRNPLPSGSDNNTLPPGGSACGTFGAAGADGFADYADLRFAPLGPQFRSQEFNRKRDGLAIAAQFESIDERTVITAEFIRSHTTNSWGERTFETGPDLAEYNTYPIGCQQNENGPGGTARAECPVGGFQDYVYDENGLFQSGYITSPNTGWRGAPGFTSIGGLQQSLATREVEDEVTNQDFSLNMRSELTDRLTIELDAQYATSRKENLDVSVFGSTFADSELDLSGDLPVGIPHKPNFTGYVWQGGANPNIDGLSDAEYFADPRVQFWRAAMDHIEDSEGDQFAFKGDIGYEFGDDSFIRKAKVGARYSFRDTQVRYTTYNWGVLSEVWGANGNVVRFGDTPSDQYEEFSFPNFFRGETQAPPTALYYSGDLIGDYAGASNFFKSINQEFQNRGGPAGWVPLAERAGVVAGTPFIPSDIQEINQTEFAGYAMLSFGSDSLFGGDMRLAGNIGVRYVNLESSSVGNIGIPSSQALNIAQPFADRCTVQGMNGPEPSTEPLCLQGPAAYGSLQQFAGATPTGVRNVGVQSTDYFLPSINLRVGVTDDVIVRLVASKVLTRPDNALLRNFLDVSLDGAGNLTAQAGNPFLEPATAWTFDATVEWYFAPVGSLTLNGFYKDISNFFFQDITTRQVENNGITQGVLVRGPANFTGGGSIKGFEVAYQHTFDFLPSPLDGFGVQANYTYIDSEGLPNSFLNGPDLPSESTVTPGSLPLEQLSKHNVNLTGFYEKGPISLRAAYNWRSRFLLTASDVIFPFYSIFNDDTGQLDASIFLDVSDNIKIGVQGVNLLNETTRTLQAFNGNTQDLAPRSYFTNDRRFSFILRGNF